MKNFSKFFLVAAASTMMFTSCSSDEPNGGQTPAEGDIYARLTLSLPQGSRSATTDPDDDGANSNSGHEVGNDSENNVGSVLVVIAQKNDPASTAGDDFTYIASNLADPHAVSSAKRPTYNVQFETRDLYDHAGEEVYVFAYCNPTTKLVEAAKNGFEGGFVNATGDISEQTIWTKNGFLMSNAAITTVTLPTQPEMDEKYNSPTNPFNLGIVKVERASARFDFKETLYPGETVNNRYPIYNHNNSNIDADGNVTNPNSTLMGYVQLDEMALINVAKSYYYLPRVSATGSGDNTADNPVSICGFETPNNYVVSPFYQQKVEKNIELSFIRNHYLYNGQPATGVSAGFDFTSADLKYEALGTNLGEDDDEGWSATDKVGYYIWKYTTENTIPQVDTQRKGITTGIAFKGHLVAADENSDLGKVITAAANPIYAYNGIIYGDLAMLKAAVLANPVSTLAETFKAAYNIKAELTEELLAPLTDLTESNGFAIYRPENGQYPMYYAYYNRHNDNGNNTVMGAMEFSVVRNNVYKIAVQKILEFGHPGKPGDDPDPEDPNDPDESPKTYFRVQVQVLPWVVRVNNIIL